MTEAEYNLLKDMAKTNMRSDLQRLRDKYPYPSEAKANKAASIIRNYQEYINKLNLDYAKQS